MIREIWNTLTSEGKRFLMSSVVSFTLYGLSGIAMVYLVLRSLETALSGGRLTGYWVALTVCLIIKGLSSIFADLRKHYAGFDLVYQIRRRIIDRLKSFSLGFYTHERLGEISTIIHKDVDNMEMVVAHLWTRMLADVIISVVLFAAMVSYNPRMAILMASALPLAVLFLVFGLKRTKRMENEAGNKLADLVSIFVEYVKGIPLLKAFSESRNFEEKLKQSARSFGQASKAISGNRAAVLSIYGLIIDLSFWIMLAVGLWMMLKGTISVYCLLFFAMISREFYKPFLALEGHWANYITVADSYGRIKRITEAKPIPEPENPVAPEKYSITFKDVSFAYEQDGFCMKEVSFHSPEHALTALVGNSGSGKTTVTNLLLRFWDLDKGAICIGDVDIRNMGYDELLASISVVMQNVQLFADSIEANLRLGKANATMEEIIAAAQKARIHDFIMSLPDGYQTVLGENGAGLSGGQKQRLSIARAFLKDAPILLLDEITSNVDPVNEVLIQDAISELAKNRTVLVIAHHLNVIRNADQIMVFQNGQLVQAGQHEKLLSDQEGYYRKLWKASSRTLLPEAGALAPPPSPPEDRAFA